MYKIILTMVKFCNCPVRISKGCVEVYREKETKKGRIKNCSESHLGRIIRYLSVAYQVSLLKRITPFDVNARPLVCAATINAVDVLQQILISRSSSWLPEAITHYVCTPTITLLSLLSNGTSTGISFVATIC